MSTEEKLKEILIGLLTQPVEPKTEPAVTKPSSILKDREAPGYNSELEKIAYAIFDKATRGDPKSIATLVGYVGGEKWV